MRSCGSANRADFWRARRRNKPAADQLSLVVPAICKQRQLPRHDGGQFRPSVKNIEKARDFGLVVEVLAAVARLEPGFFRYRHQRVNGDKGGGERRRMPSTRRDAERGKRCDGCCVLRIARPPIDTTGRQSARLTVRRLAAERPKRVDIGGARHRGSRGEPQAQYREWVGDNPSRREAFNRQDEDDDIQRPEQRPEGKTLQRSDGRRRPDAPCVVVFSGDNAGEQASDEKQRRDRAGDCQDRVERHGSPGPVKDDPREMPYSHVTFATGAIAWSYRG